MSDTAASDSSAGTLTPAREPRSDHGRSGACDQRSRLLEAILTVVASDGYGGAKIGEIAARAGVSRATFYDFFDDKQDCFNAAHEQLARHIGEQIEGEIERAEPARAAHAAVEAIAALTQREPQALSFLTHEALLAGERARTQHDQLLARLERATEHAWEQAPEDEPAPDIPARVLLGGTVRLYCMQTRRGDPQAEELLPALLRWIDCYTTDERSGSRRKHLCACERGPRPAASSAPRTGSPRMLPRGRHRLPREVVDAIQRERIAYATADVIRAHDGTAVAVAEIVAAAGVSREVFYAYFSDKEQAFLAAHQLIFEQLMAASSSAFFTPGTSWPERVWHGASAFAGLLAANPSFAHFAFVAAYGIGETGVRRMDESAVAWGLFLEEGYRARPEATELSRLTSDAIALGIMESAALYVRSGRTTDLPMLVPTVTYTALAPFIGPDAAGELVDRICERERTSAGGRPARNAPARQPRSRDTITVHKEISDAQPAHG